MGLTEKDKFKSLWPEQFGSKLNDFQLNAKLIFQELFLILLFPVRTTPNPLLRMSEDCDPTLLYARTPDFVSYQLLFMGLMAF